MRVPLRAALTCREVVELVTDYLEGKLSRRDRRRFEAHIAVCEDCTAYLDQMRLAVEALGRVPETVVSPAAREELTRAFQDWRAER
jgi:predicted anti-sigma-YlaC factor YlaD